MPQDTTMPARPLPTPPGPPRGARPNPYQSDLYSLTNPHFYPYAYPQFAPPPPDTYDEPPSSIPAGTLLHKGFYDLLAMIPTPSPSRLIWGTPPPPAPTEPIVAGPRYEDIAQISTRPAASARKGRRISKDMVSKPTGFVYAFTYSHLTYITLYFHRHLVHASDADQLEALLTRWGPDGVGKLGGQGSSAGHLFYFSR